MALSDEIKKEWKKMKEMPFEKKVEYFWDYYKWHVFGIVFVISFIGVTIYQKATTVEYDTYGAMFNVTHLDQGEKINAMLAGYEKEHGMVAGARTDLTYFEGEEFTSTNYETLQIFGTLVLAGDIDFVIADNMIVKKLAEQGYLLELPDSLNDYRRITPYVLDVSDCKILKDIYGNLSSSLALGIMVSTENIEETLAFIDYLQE